MIRARCALALVVIGCEPSRPPPEPEPPAWLYPPAIATDPLGAALGRIGRGDAPQLSPPAGIVGSGRPLRQATTWSVPGAGPARAIVAGLDGDTQAVELVEIDRGRTLWRDSLTCPGPVVGVTARAIVCADTRTARGIGLDGVARWRVDEPFVAITGDRVVFAHSGETMVRDAGTGETLAEIELPAGVVPGAVLAACEHELFAVDRDGKLVRIVDGKPVWSTPMSALLAVDACIGDAVIAIGPGPLGTAMMSISRATGKLTGRVDGVRGSWPSRDGADRIEITTATGVTRWTRDLVTPAALPLPSLGELLATRGDRRLVRATAATAALLDADGVRAYLPMAALVAALGDDAIVAAGAVRRIAIPRAMRRALHVGPVRPGVAPPAELRDLPERTPVELAGAIARPSTGMYAVSAVAVAGDQLYVVPVERAPGDTNGGGVARLDLGERGWRWHRPDGCGPGAPLGLAIARDVVVCASRGKRAMIRATSRHGQPGWEWTADNLDAVAAAGDVVLGFDADRMIALDASDGRVLGSIASDDGAGVRAAAFDVAGTTWLATYERGRVVARLPRAAMVAVWSLEVDGVIASLAASGDGVLAALEDGDAYRIDTRGAATAMPGIGLAWHGAHELVAGATAGGPIPPVIPPPPPPRPVVFVPKPPVDFEPPPFSTPVTMPPPIGTSWQLTLYELAGGLRVRNDYALSPPIALSRLRGAAGSPLVVSDAVRELVVIDPRTGDPLRRVQLPEDGIGFSTVVDGQPVAGAVLAAPLRVVLF